MFELICFCVHKYPLWVNIIKVTFRLTNHHRRLWALSIHRRDGERKIWHVIFIRRTIIVSVFSDVPGAWVRTKPSNRAMQQKIDMPLFYCYLLQVSLSILVGWTTFWPVTASRLIFLIQQGCGVGQRVLSWKQSRRVSGVVVIPSPHNHYYYYYFFFKVDSETT